MICCWGTRRFNPYDSFDNGIDSRLSSRTSRLQSTTLAIRDWLVRTLLFDCIWTLSLDYFLVFLIALAFIWALLSLLTAPSTITSISQYTFPTLADEHAIIPPQHSTSSRQVESNTTNRLITNQSPKTTPLTLEGRTCILFQTHVTLFPGHDPSITWITIQDIKRGESQFLCTRERAM